ncbi:hypothetical protein [Arthrobacter ginkgonis]
MSGIHIPSHFHDVLDHVAISTGWRSILTCSNEGYLEPHVW